MAAGGFEQLRRVVLADPAIQASLLAERERPAFVDALVTLAREQGLSVTAATVEDELNAARRRWLERWI